LRISELADRQAVHGGRAMTCLGLVVRAGLPYRPHMAGASALAEDLQVLIADDEDDMRALVRATIELADARLHVTDEAVDGEDAVAKWRERRPDVIVMDQRMPHTSGLEAARRILAEDPRQAVVVLTAFPDKHVQAAAERLGVRGWMSKNDMRLLPALLRAIHGGR
jgi:DNA-binding NarL/FixJ family response regulator